MFCNKCGNQIQEGMKFCTSCGEPINVEQQVNIVQQPVEQVIEQQNIVDTIPVQNNNIEQIPNTQFQTVNNQNIRKSNKGILNTILFSIIKPIANFKEKEAELISTSNSAILTGVVSVIVMVINLIITVATTLFTKSTKTCFMGYCYGEELSFAEKLKTIEWWPLIWQYIVIPAGLIFLISVVYYIAALIFKKNPKFGKLLGISALVLTPALIGIVLVSPLLGLIWAPLSTITIICGVIYSISILIILLYKEFSFENDDKFILFNLISVFIIIVIILLIINTLVQQSLGSLNSLF